MRFQRQKAIGNYIADFYCAKARLVIELDGGGHYDARQTEKDEARTKELQAMGLQAKVWRSRLTAKHIFTHVEWHMTGYVIEVSGSGGADWDWVDAAGLAAHAVPSAFARYYEAAVEELKQERTP